MNHHLFGSSWATTKSAAILFSSRSSHHHVIVRTGVTCFFYHGYRRAAKSPQRLIATPFSHRGRRYSTAPEKISGPLHILFCGSDDFSCASLKALHAEHVGNPDLIRSIDVVVRPGKPTGRGYKVIRDRELNYLLTSFLLAFSHLPYHRLTRFVKTKPPTRPTTHLFSPSLTHSLTHSLIRTLILFLIYQSQH